MSPLTGRVSPGQQRSANGGKGSPSLPTGSQRPSTTELTLVGQDVALLALVDDVGLGQAVLPAAVQAPRAVLADDPGDGALIQDISRSALGRRRC